MAIEILGLGRIIKPKTIVETEPEFLEIVDQDVSNYETMRWLYSLSLPLMWILTIWVMLKKKVLGIIGVKPKINTFWFDGLSIPCRKIKEGATSWHALDIIYNYPFDNGNSIRGKVSDYWLRMINAQAVRNRLQLVTQELTKAIREIAQKEKEVRLLSIASGSAQAVIEVMIRAKKEGLKVKTTLLDIDPTAINHSKKMAAEYGLESQITFITGSTYRLGRAVNGERPHIIEMVGLLDYRPDEKAVLLIKKIYELLLPDGRFLTANTCPNLEQSFMKWIIDWSMIYRRPEQLKRLITEAGFDSQETKIVCEPLNLHAVAICHKKQTSDLIDP